MTTHLLIDSIAHHGLVLPPLVLESSWFLALAGFVAINTVMFVALAVAKMLPRIYLSDWAPGRQRRSETRSIYPDSPP
ncbi:hypothetical protein [Nesterenkonia sandarakina]|uniref:Uncharacterized protein n=1 Tax=Nesterenkonia sandarakina TaxID=272918 RepID=A0A2T0YGS9_9MICC|nr:hypothetical protein [Nesterenkonia sandarakina]PRZ14221.1 hypothetical protein BCL67_11284 [Nesterenkonia sandarakina]